MLRMRGMVKCPDCKQKTAITLYIQRRIDKKRKFVPFGKFCGNCAEGIKIGREAKEIVNEVHKNRYRFGTKIKTKGAPT